MVWFHGTSLLPWVSRGRHYTISDHDRCILLQEGRAATEKREYELATCRALIGRLGLGQKVEGTRVLHGRLIRLLQYDRTLVVVK